MARSNVVTEAKKWFKVKMVICDSSTHVLASLRKLIKNTIGIFFDITKSYYSINHGLLLFKEIQDRIICKVTGLCAGWCRVQILAGVRDFSLIQNVQTIAGAHHLPLPWVQGVISSGIKRRADHSSLSSPLVKNVWNYTSLPPCVPAWCAQGQLLPFT
jgi:hypothetical protein